jgi:hypothetical protein
MMVLVGISSFGISSGDTVGTVFPGVLSNSYIYLGGGSAVLVTVTNNGIVAL